MFLLFVLCDLSLEDRKHIIKTRSNFGRSTRWCYLVSKWFAEMRVWMKSGLFGQGRLGGVLWMPTTHSGDKGAHQEIREDVMAQDLTRSGPMARRIVKGRCSCQVV